MGPFVIPNTTRINYTPIVSLHLFIMATDQLEALETVKQLQTQKLKEEYGGKASNLFVQEIKSAALFQCNWGELLSAAPTALSLMGSCWIAASQDKAEQIFLGDARPKDGFKYLTNRDKPTLRACLVDGQWKYNLCFVSPC